MENKIIIPIILALSLGFVVHGVENENKDIPGYVSLPCAAPQTVTVPYPCTLTVKRIKCVQKDIPIEDACYSPAPITVNFACPKSEEEYKDKCVSVPVPNTKMCTRQKWEEEYVNSTRPVIMRQCRIVSAPTNEICFAQRNYNKAYECEGSMTVQNCTLQREKTGIKTCTVVKEVPVEYSFDTDVDVAVVSTKIKEKKGYCRKFETYYQSYNCPVDRDLELCYQEKDVDYEVCEKEITKQEPYDCSEVAQQNVPHATCSTLVMKTVKVQDPDFTGFTNPRIAPLFTDFADDAVNYVERQYQEMENRPCSASYAYSVPKLCHRQIQEKITTKCQKKVEKKECQNVPFQFPFECKKPIVMETEVECLDQKEDVLTTDYKKTVKAMGSKIESVPITFMCPEYDFSENCENVTTPYKDVCYAKMIDNQPEQCQRLGLAEVCEEKTVQQDAIVVQYNMYPEEFHCLGVIWEERCGSGPTSPTGECFMNAQTHNITPCWKPSKASICNEEDVEVKATCLKQEQIPFTTLCINACYGPGGCDPGVEAKQLLASALNTQAVAQ